MLATQLKYDLLMFSRELFYMVFTIIVPPVTYLFMGQLFGDQTYAGNLSYAETYTPSFILLITFGVIFFAFGFDQVMNRTTGVEKRISLSPVPKKMLLLSAILKSIILTSIGFFLVYFIGMIAYDLAFEPIRFLSAYGFFIILNAVSTRHFFSHLFVIQKYERSTCLFHRHFPSRHDYRRFHNADCHDAEIRSGHGRREPALPYEQPLHRSMERAADV